MTSPAPVEPPAFISRQTLFGNPNRASVQLSPNGQRISYLAPLEGVLNVWVGPTDSPESARPVTRDQARGIRFYGWTYTNDHLTYIQDKDGDENWHVYIVDLASGDIRDLTPIEGVQARIQETSPQFPEELLIGLNDRNPQLHDVYQINIVTGTRGLVQQNDGFAGFLTDENFNVRFALRLTSDGGSEMLRLTETGHVERFIKVDMEDTLTTSPIGFDQTGSVMYLVDSRGRNTAALTSLNLDTGELTLIAEDDRADVSDTVAHPTEKTLQAVSFTYLRKEWQTLDPSIAPDLDYLRTVADGDIEVTSRTLDDRHWIVAYLLDNGPVRYYHYDREQKDARFLFTNRKALEGLPLARMHPVSIKSRDNRDLVSYYTLPLDSDQEEDGHPDHPLPTVLLVHGGPWHRDDWGYNPLHQLLANRGYAVLSVNFRGSTGLGKDFINAANLEWGGKMYDDLIDTVQWTINQGMADPERMAIMGGSYGGYATLVGLTFTPDIFACGVDIVGPSNLFTLINSIPPYWQPQIELWATRVGDHRTEEGQALLNERSPLSYVDQICRPLLIGQGANDPRVKQSESDQIVQAMQAKGIPVTYVLYPDEGHGFARPENNLSFFVVAEAFLSKCLGGRHEPVGEDFKGSSITVPSGKEHVPGLAEALQ